MKGKALRILLVEDNVGDARLLREMFSKEKPDSYELTHLLRLGDAEIHLAKGAVDIALLDMGLPDGHGIDTLRRARAIAPEIPMIVLTGLDDEALAAEAMRQGAQDYLIKGQIENRALPRALRHAIERHRMQTETDLIRSNQLQFKDEFLSHVSHELRSPLSAIYQYVTILVDKLAGELNPEQREYLGIVLRNVKQLQSMINDLFEVTRMQAGKVNIDLQCTSLPEAISYSLNTLQGAAAAKGISLSSNLQARLPSVCSDPTRIRQILIILIENAIKFTPANGKVKLEARVTEEHSDLVVVEVSDTGCGISADMIEQIFERLFQASDEAPAGRKGLGLGLYICRELVTRQNGQIWVRSVLGEGTVFSLTLPIFSVQSLVAPTLRRAWERQGLITLVIIEVGSHTGWLSQEVRREQSKRIRALVQHCLHSDLDILLPKMGSAGPVELFFIVASTDDIGGEAICKRVRERWSENEALQQAGLTLSTSYRRLPAIERKAGMASRDFLENGSFQIQELMDVEVSLRTVKNG
jgi:signal transduction histidine kinase